MNDAVKKERDKKKKLEQTKAVNKVLAPKMVGWHFGVWLTGENTPENKLPAPIFKLLQGAFINTTMQLFRMGILNRVTKIQISRTEVPGGIVDVDGKKIIIDKDKNNGNGEVKKDGSKDKDGKKT